MWQNKIINNKKPLETVQIYGKQLPLKYRWVYSQTILKNQRINKAVLTAKFVSVLHQKADTLGGGPQVWVQSEQWSDLVRSCLKIKKILKGRGIKLIFKALSLIPSTTTTIHSPPPKKRGRGKRRERKEEERILFLYFKELERIHQTPNQKKRNNNKEWKFGLKINTKDQQKWEIFQTRWIKLD